MEKKHFETINVCSLFLLILFLVTGRRVFLYIGMGLLGVSIFVKPLGRLIAVGWLKFSYLVGTFNSRVLLTIFFYVFLTPLAVLRRLLGQRLLQLEKREEGSYWKDIDKEFSREDLEKIW
jgi:hypothetical protein